VPRGNDREDGYLFEPVRSQSNKEDCAENQNGDFATARAASLIIRISPVPEFTPDKRVVRVEWRPTSQISVLLLLDFFQIETAPCLGSFKVVGQDFDCAVFGGAFTIRFRFSSNTRSSSLAPASRAAFMKRFR
jgi:hypothetical protein